MADRTLLFAHGAGAPSSHPWMQGWSQRLSGLGQVVPFDYPYIKAGKRIPDRLNRLMAAHLEAAAGARGRLILVGKSMGSRVGCHVANNLNAAAVVCLGYPLVSSGSKKQIRDKVLLDLRVPVLFIQGTRDRMGPLDRFAEVRDRMSVQSTLHIVTGGDHSLLLSKTHCRETGDTQEASDTRILEAISTFLQSTCS